MRKFFIAVALLCLALFVFCFCSCDRNISPVTDSDADILATVLQPEIAVTSENFLSGSENLLEAATSGKTDVQTTVSEIASLFENPDSSVGNGTTNMIQDTASENVGSIVPTERENVGIKNGEYEFSLRTDKTEVSPGDTFTITLHLRNCKDVACFNIVMGSSENALPSKNSNGQFRNADGDQFTIYPNISGHETYFGGFITTSYTFSDDDLCSVTYRVVKNAFSGDSVTVSTDVTMLLVALDETGASTAEYAGYINIPSVTVKVK